MEKMHYRYWGKAKKDQTRVGAEYHLLVYHSLDVAAVGHKLLNPKHKRCKHLAKRLKVDPQWLQQWFVFCLCLHDLGKFARAFQGLATNLSEQLVAPDQRCVYQVRHDTLGFVLWKNVLAIRLSDIFPTECKQLVADWLEVVCGHHGQPPEKALVHKGRNHFLPEDEEAAEAYIRELIPGRLPDLAPLATIAKDDYQTVSWQLAGLAVLADWLGSDQSVFHYKSDPVSLEDYWKEVAIPSTERSNDLALFDSGRCHVVPFQGIHEQFDFITQPSPLQEYAQKVPLGEGAQLFILEDVTGAGKTEAAMVLTHRLMELGVAEGLYLGLPSMATANAMYQRLANSYNNLYGGNGSPSLVLAHSARHLSGPFQQSVGLTEHEHDRSTIMKIRRPARIVVGGSQITAKRPYLPMWEWAPLIRHCLQCCLLGISHCACWV